MFFALLWMEQWLKFLSEASAQYTFPQLAYTTAVEPGTEAAEGPAGAALMEEAALLRHALEERDQALASLLLARSELLSHLAQVSGEAKQERDAAQTERDSAVLAERQAWAGENDRLKAAQRRANVQSALERTAARAERETAVLAERQAWAGENDRLKAAQRRANLQFALERAAARAERDAWAGENERLKAAQRHLRVQSALERAAALAAQAAEQAAARADADATGKATLAQVHSALGDRDAALAAKDAALAEAMSGLVATKDGLAEARAEILRLQSRAAADRAQADERIALLTTLLEAAQREAGAATAKAEAPVRKPRAKTNRAKNTPEVAPPSGDAPAAAPTATTVPAPVEARTEPAGDVALSPSADELVLGFKKPADWGATAFVYFWDTDPLSDKPAWPGVPMQADADGWFVHHLPGIRSAHLIFTDDTGHQTPNLHRTASGWLDEDGAWRVERPVAPA